MWSNENVRSRLRIGYHFIHNGTYHVIDGLYKDRLHCRTQEGGSYYMTYTYFQTTNHFKSRYMNFPKKKSCNSAILFLSLLSIPEQTSGKKFHKPKKYIL